MKKIAFTILLVVLGGFNAFGQTSEITAEEYEFYLNILNPKYVLTRETYAPEQSYLQYAKKKMRSLPQELVNDFNLKNKKSYRIEDKLGGFRFSDQPKPVRDTDKQIVFLFDAFETVSRVGFTKDKKQALIYYLQSCEGTSCAYGGFYWYVYEKENWKIKKHIAIPIF